MILGTKRLLELVETQDLVEGLAERELASPEGAGFDLRVGKAYSLIGEGELWEEERKTPRAEGQPILDNGRYYLILGYTSYLVETLETVNIPKDLFGQVFPRTTLLRSGLSLVTGPVHPGYEGTLTFSLVNHRHEPFKLAPKARIPHIVFHRIEGETAQYRGQWQGGRVAQPELERQV